MSQKITATHERVDDRPVIIAQLEKMRVAELLDDHFPTTGNWTGLRLGWVSVVWGTFMLSEGDHRLSHVEQWVKEPQRTLRRCPGRRVKPRDGTDDRLAPVRDALSVTENWVACERALNQSVMRVYTLQAHMVRVDSTTGSACITRCRKRTMSARP